MSALSHKIPVTPWRAASTWAFRPSMFLPLIGGLAIFGFGEGLLVQSEWGATPWTVFAQGITKHTHLSIGWATLLISAGVLLLWFPLREKPGLGTIANLLVIAYALDLTAAHLPVASNFAMKAIYVVGAIMVIGIGSSLYLTTGLGPGPRDGLMTSLHRKLGVSIVYVRICIEATVLTIGWLLGGTVGVGTTAFTIGIGFSIGFWLGVMERIVKLMQHD